MKVKAQKKGKKWRKISLPLSNTRTHSYVFECMYIIYIYEIEALQMNGCEGGIDNVICFQIKKCWKKGKMKNEKQNYYSLRDIKEILQIKDKNEFTNSTTNNVVKISFEKKNKKK